MDLTRALAQYGRIKKGWAAKSHADRRIDIVLLGRLLDQTRDLPGPMGLQQDIVELITQISDSLGIDRDRDWHHH